MSRSAGPATPRPDRIHTLQRFEQEMGVLLRRVRRVVAERARAIHPSLQPAGYQVLARLVVEGEQRSSHLVEAFELDKATVSRTVQHLVDLGLVTRRPDPDDGRATLVAATPVADERFHAVARERLERLDSRLADWSDDELADLVAAFARYNSALEAGSGHEPATVPQSVPAARLS